MKQQHMMILSPGSGGTWPAAWISCCGNIYALRILSTNV